MSTSIDSGVQQGDALSDSLYAAHQKIYPREVPGRFRQWRTLAMLVLLGLFYGMAWITWDEHPALLFDLPARRFYVFGLIFLPQDFYLLTWLLVIAALSLFMFTSLAGRLWCGYACPQTVWTDAFVWLERLAEGTRQQRIKLDRAPWSLHKAQRKLLKHGLWLVFALYTGFTFVGYFTPIRELAHELQSMSAGPWETFWVLFYGFATWGNAGFMREQVCKYMCPYARFQSAMFDRHTLIISYDQARGEPRGARRRGQDHRADALGDCLDCQLCVQACPTGIDIRQGLQYECIACAACIDACDSVMDKMAYPRGLVRYSTQAAVEGHRAHLLRPRTVVYAGLWLLLVGGFGYALTQRSLLELDVLRERNALYRDTDDGRIENVYTLRIINKDTQPHHYRLSVHGLNDAQLVVRADELVAGATQVNTLTARVVAPPTEHGGMRRIEFVLQADGVTGSTVRTHSRFYSPE